MKYGKAKDEYSTPKPNGALNQLWNESPNLIKKYFNEYPNYQQLCGEVVFILEKELKNGGRRRGTLVQKQLISIYFIFIVIT